MRRVTLSEGADMVFEGAFVLEIGTTHAEPELAAVLLVGAPVSAHGKRLTAFAAREGLDAVLSLVVGL